MRGRVAAIGAGVRDVRDLTEIGVKLVKDEKGRSVRDAARYYDVCAGVDAFDPSTIPSPGGWEAGLGSHDLRGKRGGRGGERQGEHPVSLHGS